MSAAADKLATRLAIRDLGLQDYEPVWRAMQSFTDSRDASTDDEIWFTEHPPVYTLGLNASREHLLAPGEIPVVQVDRGGEVTYHGPGQLMIYPLVDLTRARLGVRDMVTALEQSVVDLAAGLGIVAKSWPDAPGVYVAGKKLASVGLRVRRGSSYHGMALNVDVDPEPFQRINPCGFADLEVTNLATLGVAHRLADVKRILLPHLVRHLRLDGVALVDARPELPPFICSGD